MLVVVGQSAREPAEKAAEGSKLAHVDVVRVTADDAEHQAELQVLSRDVPTSSEGFAINGLFVWQRRQ